MTTGEVVTRLETRKALSKRFLNDSYSIFFHKGTKRFARSKPSRMACLILLELVGELMDAGWVHIDTVLLAKVFDVDVSYIRRGIRELVQGDVLSRGALGNSHLYQLNCHLGWRGPLDRRAELLPLTPENNKKEKGKVADK